MLKPQTSSTRELVSLDGLWRFAVDKGDGSLPCPWSSKLPGTLEAPVPASYNDLFVDSSIREHAGWVWYQRNARVPRGWAGQRVVVRVEAATHEGVVFVDDTKVARHVGGYTPFEADITDLVSPGAEFRLTVGVNSELTFETIPPGQVKVTDDGRRQQRIYHDFFNYSGLARSVWLASRPATYVDDMTVTTDVEGQAGIVRVKTVVAGGAADVRLTLRDEDGAVVAQGSGADAALRVPDVKLWQPGAAYLYSLTIEATVAGDVVDEYVLPVGVRTVEVRGTQFLVNGKPFYFTGFGKHEDSAVRGKGHDQAYLVHDSELMSWIGANSFRTSHYPYAEEVMEYADRHGIVVIDETAAVGLNLGLVGGLFGELPRPTFSKDTISDVTRQVHAQHLRELVARDKNHPSVVMWSITNEPASHEQGAREYFQPLAELTRELDPSRPITYVNMMLATPDKELIADLFDVICVNRYYGWYVNTGDLATAEAHLEAELRAWETKYGKPLIMTEYGADTMPGVHSVWDQPWTEEYQTKVLEMFGRVHDRIPAIVGEQVWNFADFQTTAGVFRVDGNKKGVFTRDRKPKSAAHALRKRWTAMGSEKPAAKEIANGVTNGYSNGVKNGH